MRWCCLWRITQRRVLKMTELVMSPICVLRSSLSDAASSFFFLHHHIFAIKQQYDYTIEYHVTFYYCICILTIRWVRQLLTSLVYTQIRENYIHIVKVYTEWFLPPHHLVYCSCAKADPLSEDEVFPFREKPPSADWRTLWNNTASKSKFVT